MSPGKTEALVIERHLAAIDRAVKQLRKHLQASPAEFAKDLDSIWAVERGLQLCAQNCLDIATHLAASAGIDTPDYAAAIDALVELEILEETFGLKFRGIAGFRNILVHSYLEVDPKRLYTILKQDLEDFVVFAKAVSAYVQR